jgi:hypothetical protein
MNKKGIVRKFKTWKEAEAFRDKIGTDSVTERYHINKRTGKVSRITYIVEEA